MAPSASQIERAGIIAAPPRVRTLQKIVAEHRPSWLLLTCDLEDGMAEALVGAGRAVARQLLTAMLGPCGDAERCSRWMRRGVRVYLGSGSSFGRVMDSLRFAELEDALIIDRCFYAEAQRHQVQPVAKLTRRELDVLRLARLGLSNSELASQLYVAESTVEFHIRNLLTKFAAKNRVQMIERATRIGI
jgi:DNA-binding NarL/FixJ family response regulator